MHSQSKFTTDQAAIRDVVLGHAFYRASGKDLEDAKASNTICEAPSLASLVCLENSACGYAGGLFNGRSSVIGDMLHKHMCYRAQVYKLL